MSCAKIVICSLICLYTLVAYIANNKNPDQTETFGAVWSGFIVFASMIKVFLSAFEYMQQMYKKWTTFSEQTKIWHLILPENQFFFYDVTCCKIKMTLEG